MHVKPVGEICKFAINVNGKYICILKKVECTKVRVCPLSYIADIFDSGEEPEHY